MTGALVWFLILANWNGGMLLIEQPSYAACDNTAKWITSHRYDTNGGWTVGARCVQGVKP